MKKLSYEFVKEKIEKEGYKLLSKEYINSRSKLKLRCNKGHEYEAKYNSFSNGKRCPYCNGGIRLTYEFIKKQIEKERYELLSSEYINSISKLKLRCNKGHEYEAVYGSFKNGHRCPICSGKQKHSYEFIKKQIEKEGYKLLSKEYINNYTKLKLRCNKGHEYEVRWHDFKKNIRCRKCSGGVSKEEKRIIKYLKSLNINIIENDRSIIPPFELDVVIPSHKLAIEYCGLYWHNEKFIDKNYHKNKLELCNQAGYRLITIFEDEWVHKKEIVKNRLKYILGLNTERIYARKCTIKEINTKKAREFINKYHIQGYSNCKIKLGAFYKDKLIAVMTFSNASIRGNKNINTYELNRFCTSNSIVGIASKLLKYFQRNYKYNKIITFADRRWSEGKLYEKIGFKKCYNVDLNYFYVNGNNRIHRFNFRKNVLKDKLEKFDQQLSERENMKNNSWLRIYDCGNIKYSI